VVSQPKMKDFGCFIKSLFRDPISIERAFKNH